MDSVTQRLMMGAAGSAGPKIYVEDVFSTWLYTGNGSTQTITNGIDLSGKGGLVWTKSRSAAYNNTLYDTARGATKAIFSNADGAEATVSTGLTSFSTTGYALGSHIGVNENASTYASWTFRKQAKFFDVVTFSTSGTLSSSRALAHNLGSAPGFVIIKSTTTTQNWLCYHRSLGQSSLIYLNTTGAQNTTSQWWTATAPTSTQFYLDETALLNTNQSYVAYLFAHDAGGFGDSGNESVVSCGTFTTDGSGNVGTVNLGWEPQYILAKRSNGTQSWYVFDTMRGMALTSTLSLTPNLSDAELNWTTSSGFIYPTATGFAGTGNFFGPNAQVAYIAIRRGPMKTPTDATKVFAMDTLGGTLPNPPGFNSSFPVDLGMFVDRSSPGVTACTRLQGSKDLYTYSTNAEGASAREFDYNNGWLNNTAIVSTYLSWMFRRAPGFFDVVAYTGTGSARTVSHNLGVVPELIISKSRSNGNAWYAYASALGAGSYLRVNSNGASVSDIYAWNNTSPTSSVFSLGASVAADTNNSGWTFVAYLFATCPGVSKVGSYTGTGTTLSVDCGFTNGARFVLIKRTDSTGDWYGWDTARGIVSGNDPYLLLNSTAAEVTNTDYIDPLSSGFQISSTAPAAINANGGTFIYLAIA